MTPTATLEAVASVKAAVGQPTPADIDLVAIPTYKELVERGVRELTGSKVKPEARMHTVKCVISMLKRKRVSMAAGEDAVLTVYNMRMHYAFEILVPAKAGADPKEGSFHDGLSLYLTKGDSKAVVHGSAGPNCVSRFQTRTRA